MSAFDQLHPALQHHVVNSLGWRELRPLQEVAIPPVLSGSHCLLLAPTAGGKTESAMFPLLSRMLSENWQGVSVLYVCPLRALLNNLHHRLEFLAGLVGRSCAVWHGDATETTRNRIRRERPDILLTTPESLESMFISCRTDHQWLFGDLQTVVVDEIHAFAGDDRGWHLLCVLERLTRVAGHELQRIGLSATVGNPAQLLEWFAGHCAGARQIVSPSADKATNNITIQIDYVGTLENAATVISRLHRGEKRLVFCDSRARVEQLGALLQQADVETFVSHGSLSGPERRRAEGGFAEAHSGVMVATSALELGIDLGDLDRVIQIDAPATVSSFLQRIGRTGRRPGTVRNGLFLTTTPEMTVQAAAIVDLIGKGFVEPTIPPAYLPHLFVQQVIGLILQERGLTRSDLQDWLGRLSPIAGTGEEECILNHMLAEDILMQDQGVLGMGVAGERRYGKRHYLEVLSVFTSPPVFTAWHGRHEIGNVDASALNLRSGEPTILLLAGKTWQVDSVNWSKRILTVTPVQASGKSRWTGQPAALGAELCAAIRDVLLGTETHPSWSRRAQESIQQSREAHDFLSRGPLTLQARNDSTRLWTFAGRRCNAALSFATLAEGRSAVPNNLFLDINGTISVDFLTALASRLTRPESFIPDTLEGLDLPDIKFSDALPSPLRTRLHMDRALDVSSALATLTKPRTYPLE